MVYSITFSPFENFSIATEDRNIGRRLGDHDKATCVTYSEHEPDSIADPFSVRKPTLRNAEFEERQGN